MKKIALISTFCDTEDKVQILIENIRTLKNIGLDTLVISPIILPSKVIELSDFVFFTGLKDPQWALEGAQDPVVIPVDVTSAARALGLA